MPHRRRFNTGQAVRHILAILGGAVAAYVVDGMKGIATEIQVASFFLGSLATGLLLGLYRRAPDVELIDVDAEQLLGRRVRVMQRIDPEGKILYRSRLWQAVADEPIEQDEWAEIVAVHGRKVKVRRCKRST
ncbi:MAG: hypothetical protein D6678_03835 [Zetaproteobacteria bacterium]|nr:MAG: hypothetical protein D6678_03835 [Zetaproteobacteria bacterium]